MLKKTVNVLGRSILLIVGLLVLYVAAAWLLPKISVNNDHKQAVQRSMYILTNGVHTDLVLPVQSPEIDWRKLVPVDNTQAKDTATQWLAFGWGDKGFYLETPTWADLKFSTAIKAAFGLSTTAIHATYYRSLIENEECKRIAISTEHYQELVDYIRQSFQQDEQGNFLHIETTANYGKNDAFYEALGSYNLFYTCNTWANNGLKACGQKACFWTPFDKGIFDLYSTR